MRIEQVANLYRATTRDGDLTLSVTAPSRGEAMTLLLDLIEIRHKEPSSVQTEV